MLYALKHDILFKRCPCPVVQHIVIINQQIMKERHAILIPVTIPFVSVKMLILPRIQMVMFALASQEQV